MTLGDPLVARKCTLSRDYRKPGFWAHFRRAHFRNRRVDAMFWSWYEPRNFGDWIGPYLYEAITGEIPFFVGRIMGRRRLHRRLLFSIKSFSPCLFTAGSILRHIRHPDFAAVWGSGIISREDSFPRPKSTLAVRGPRSQERLRELGFPYPETVGDPGVLLPLFHAPEKAKARGRIGVIPHYVDYEAEKNRASDDVHVIDVTLPVEQVANEIARCELTFSSSLHGLIVSHAYGVPCVWHQSRKPLMGDGVKFTDYLESVGVLGASPAILPDALDMKSLARFEKYAVPPPRNHRLKIMQENLLKACPFAKETNISLNM